MQNSVSLQMDLSSQCIYTFTSCWEVEVLLSSTVKKNASVGIDTQVFVQTCVFISLAWIFRRTISRSYVKFKTLSALQE
jgi:hypothetical protein